MTQSYNICGESRTFLVESKTANIYAFVENFRNACNTRVIRTDMDLHSEVVGNDRILFA